MSPFLMVFQGTGRALFACSISAVLAREAGTGRISGE